MDVNRVGYSAPPPPSTPATTPVVADATPVAVPMDAGAPAYVPVANGVDGNGQQPQERAMEQRLEGAVTALNQSLAPHQRHMSVDTHRATGRIMVAVYDTETRELIREIPPERVLDAHASLMEMAGLFMDRRG
ncbi:MAG: flagellar protein FlaG [Defluviitaleaceae bacterium]|nr:flagellar protein FlaG [Defluviitaleaceae bacterium]MCL2275698.1 flagellar protein FlaG [Defluviitaleaceae bacterium]